MPGPESLPYMGVCRGPFEGPGIAQKMHNEEYNGWRNRQTWNAALWISNDEAIYGAILSLKERAERYGRRLTWARARVYLAANFGPATDDGVSWLDSRISGREMSAMLRELS